MKLIPYCLLFTFFIAFCSCSKKSNEVIPAKTETVSLLNRDSISLSIAGATAVYNVMYRTGTGNRAVNIKLLAAGVTGGKLAYSGGGYNWYGVPDSTLYDVNYGFKTSDTSSNNIQIIFTKKYKDSELAGVPNLLYAKNHLDIFKKGMVSFATDFRKENTKDGVIIEFGYQGKLLSTAIPGSSIYDRSNLTNDIQNNSSFEITSVKQVKGDKYLVEAKFEANFFDNDANLYRVKNGYMKFNVYMTPISNGGNPIFWM